ncbi:sensor domain-containing diguanylate cyclase [Vibrio artabrorum]|uniref:sensor domain-containing diguanylate cyclase n=1 Tax=Vibrio artabrorum TaxID=446374 RepID=UPI0021C37C46|nr:sensor domain-containing diguanylate cyclase [Vibrio artabrorum]
MKQQFLLEGHRAVNSLLRKLALGMDRQDLNHKIIQLTEQLFGQRVASILLLNSESNTLHLECAPNLPDFYNQQIEGIEIGIGVGSCGEAAALKKGVIVSNINTHPNWAPFLTLTNQANLHACWSVPIISSHGQVLGTFAIYSRTPSNPHEFELEILELLASLYSVALEKYELENQLNFFANHDSLTHCLNRRALLSEVEKVLTKRCFANKELACLFVDVDKFKSINDTFGHSFGDRVLLIIAKVLDEETSTCSKVGRYGGDEFVVFSCFDNQVSVVNFYHGLQRALEQALFINGIQFTVSMGFSYTKDPESLEALIAQADQSMYQIKQAKSQQP